MPERGWQKLRDVGKLVFQAEQLAGPGRMEGSLGACAWQPCLFQTLINELQGARAGHVGLLFSTLRTDCSPNGERGQGGSVGGGSGGGSTPPGVARSSLHGI